VRTYKKSIDTFSPCPDPHFEEALALNYEILNGLSNAVDTCVLVRVLLHQSFPHFLITYVRTYKEVKAKQRDTFEVSVVFGEICKEKRGLASEAT